jgi:hypothetical protein
MRAEQYRATSKPRVIDLSDNDQMKQPAEQGHRMSLPREQTSSTTTSPPMDDAEQAMRRALGLFGDASRPRPEGERTEQVPRPGGGFSPGLHRRRFVQDGEVPVTVVRRDTQDAAHPGGGQAAPTSSRLQRVEGALAGETARADRAERALHDTQAALQALQTKIGHNELAKNEALAASKRHGDEIVSLREELTAAAERLSEAESRAHAAEEELGAIRSELSEERRARKLAERLLRETSEEPAQATHETPVAPALRDPGERMPPRRGRPPTVRAEEPEDEQDAKPPRRRQGGGEAG